MWFKPIYHVKFMCNSHSSMSAISKAQQLIHALEISDGILIIDRSLHLYITFLDTQSTYSTQPPPMCSTHLGDARLPFCARTHTTHQLRWGGREQLNQLVISWQVETAMVGNLVKTPGNPLHFANSVLGSLMTTVRSLVSHLIREMASPTAWSPHYCLGIGDNLTSGKIYYWPYWPTNTTSSSNWPSTRPTP